jgi:type II restriction enzyme
VVRHQLSTNDPNTFYRLRPEAERVFRASAADLDAAIADVKQRPGRAIRRLIVPDENVIVDLGGTTISLTRGSHHFLEKQIVEYLLPRILRDATILYVGDTARKVGFQNREAMRELNLPIDVAASLPDVIAADLGDRTLVVAEAVTSGGPISATRRLELDELVKEARDLSYDVVYVTAFLNRKAFRKFVEEIAWGTRVWIAEEPDHIAWFNGPS